MRAWRCDWLACRQVSVIPRGASALGFTQHLHGNRYLYSAQQLHDRMVALLGGRAAEEVCAFLLLLSASALGIHARGVCAWMRMRAIPFSVSVSACICLCHPSTHTTIPPSPPPLSIGRQTIFKRVTTGARDDLERVTQMAYDQVMRYGMGKQVRPQPPSPPSSCSLLLSRPRPPPLLIFFFSVSCAHVVLAVLRHACLCVRVCFVCVFLPGWLVGPSHPSRRQRGQEAVQQPLESTV